MFKQGHIVRALLLPVLAAAFSLPSYADTYDIDFTAGSGTAPVSGSFTYNGTDFTAFSIAWSSGASIDLAQFESDLTDNGYSQSEYFANAFEAAAPLDWSTSPFAMLLNDGYNNIAFVATDGYGIPYGQGTYTVTDTSAVTPEPGTLLLLGTGFLGLALLSLRKRAKSSPRLMVNT